MGFEKKLQFVRQYFQAITLPPVCSLAELLTPQLALTVPIFSLLPLLSLKQQYLIRLNYLNQTQPTSSQVNQHQ